MNPGERVLDTSSFLLNRAGRANLPPPLRYVIKQWYSQWYVIKRLHPERKQGSLRTFQTKCSPLTNATRRCSVFRPRVQKYCHIQKPRPRYCMTRLAWRITSSACPGIRRPTASEDHGRLKIISMTQTRKKNYIFYF